MKKSTNKINKVTINEGSFLALISLMLQIRDTRSMLERIKNYYLLDRDRQFLVEKISEGHDPIKVLNSISVFNNLDVTSTYLNLYSSHGITSTERYNVQELAFLKTSGYLKDLTNKLTLRILVITFLSYIVPVALAIFSIKYGLIGTILFLGILIIFTTYISLDTKRMILLLRDVK
ncbi:MAG: hypothetical protein ACP5GU_01345 [Thermoprotei archaeon]